jgi:hypothetical protein
MWWKILKDPRIIVIALALAFLIMQAIRIEKGNPKVQADIATKPEIKSLLRRSCYNCHSNETVWPWYSHLAPASWLIAHDVRDGRQSLNFSEWGNYKTRIQSDKLGMIAKEISEENMPPWYYSMMHSDERLTPANRGEIWAWALTESETVLK